MHFGILEFQGNKHGILTMVLAMKKLAKQSHLSLPLKFVVLMNFQMEFFKALILDKGDLEESQNMELVFIYFI